MVGGALEFRTLAQHWNGSGWTTVPTPDVETAPAKDLLFGASAAGPDDIWAAGISSTSPSSAASKPLVLHWNGSQWSIVALPATPIGSSLSAIGASAGAVWAVGEQYNPASGYYKPLVLRLQGGAWEQIPFPATTGECKMVAGGTFFRYSPGGVAVRPNGDAYISGACASPVGDRAVLALFRGDQRRIAFDPTTLPSTSVLNDVDFERGGELRAVGGEGVNPLILHGSGVNFTREPAPTIGRGTSLNSVSQGIRPYAVGTSTGTDAWAHPAVMRYSGGRWRAEHVSIDFGNPFGVALAPGGQAWTTGVSVSDDAGLILQRNTSP